MKGTIEKIIEMSTTEPEDLETRLYRKVKTFGTPRIKLDSNKFSVSRVVTYMYRANGCTAVGSIQ